MRNGGEQRQIEGEDGSQKHTGGVCEFQQYWCIIVLGLLELHTFGIRILQDHPLLLALYIF